MSGKEQLEFTGLVDLRAPQGRKGQLLLDPEDITIVRSDPASTLAPTSNNTTSGSVFEPAGPGAVTITDAHLSSQLGMSDVLVKTSSANSTGTGGQITVNGDAVISWSRGSSLTLDADKGIDMLGTISTSGDGAVHLKARNGDVAVAAEGTITARKVKLEALAGNVLFDTLSVNPVESGADGAKLEIFASGDVIGDRIQANGGSGGAPGAAGGKGGTVHIRFGRDLAVSQIQADGGLGAAADSVSGGNGGHGGDGGKVILERTGGDLVLDGIEVSGAGGSGGSSSAASGGNGGNGGKLVLKSPGKIELQYVRFSAFGGGGGSGSAYGTEGDFGRLETARQTVDVGSLHLDAVWNNTGKVNVGTESSIWGSGTLVNSGQLNIGSYSDIDVEGGVKNRGLLEATGTSADVHLVENTGTVYVAAGADLRAHAFRSNQGVLDVHGAMNVDPGTVSCDDRCSPVIASFRNETSGTISGTGTLAVASGGGTLDNHGKIAPGGVGSVGKLAVQGNVVMQSSSVFAVDLVNELSHDILEVSGTATTGGTVEVLHPAGSRIAAGDTFAVLQAGTLDAATLPTPDQGHIVASASGNNLVLRSTAAVPAPSSGPTARQLAQQQVISQVVAFQQLFEQQLDQEEGNGIGRDDIVVTDTACKPR